MRSTPAATPEELLGRILAVTEAAAANYDRFRAGLQAWGAR